MKNINNKNLNTKEMDSIRLNQDMLANAIENSLLGELEKQQTRCEHRCPDDSMSTKAVRKKMEKKRIEEIRKSLNIDDSLQFDFAEELVLWIIGGYGPIDIQEEFASSLLPIPDYAKIEKAFRPYITTEDYSVYKFKTPYWSGGRDLLVEDIYFIQCIKNGISYFACSNLAILRAFVDKENN